MKKSCPVYSRRQVLKLASSSALVTAVPAFAAGCNLIRPDLDTVARAMIGTLNHLDRAREIGRGYMEDYPEVQQRTYEQLTRELLAVLELELDDLSYLSLDLGERLGERVRQDFVEENIVIVGKWMFSRTEAALCALAAAYA